MTVRYALDRGISVVVEGIFEPSRYGDMLTAVATDHLGVTRAYVWNIDFAETVRRYGTKTKAADFGEAEMATWWYGLSLVNGLNEAIVTESESVSDVLGRIRADCGWD